MSLIAQEAQNRLATAHAQYYTPTTSGLKSFNCDVSIDWKALFSRIRGSEISEDNPSLMFLKTVHLTINDNLRGNGELEWSSTAEPTASIKPNIQQMKDGMQTTISGFFQTWNAYMNGSMVPLPDSTVTVTNSGDGVHLSGTSKEATLDEDYDKNMLLTKVLVTSPSLTILAKPTFDSTEDGLILSSVTSLIHQPTTAPGVETTLRIEYAKVDSFQIPSHVVIDIKNIGVIEFRLNACKVTVADWTKKN